MRIKEWCALLFLITVGKSITQVQALLDTTYSGWEIANRQQVYDLIQNNFDIYNWGVENNYSTSSSFLGTVEKMNELTQMFDGFDFSNSKSITAYFLNDSLEDGIAFGKSTLSYFPTGLAAIGISSSANFTADDSYPWLSVFLVNSGGVTLSSIEDPSINVANVPLLSSGLGLFGFAFLAGARRKKAN